MRFFFRSRGFKIFVVTVVALLAVSVAIVAFSRITSPFSGIVGSVVSPVQKFFSNVASEFDDFIKKLSDGGELMDEIEKLKSENAELNDKLLQYEQTEQENKFYEEFLGIKEKNPEMLFQSANICARDITDPYKSFTLDVGLLDGVELYDPVITEDGLVGLVTEIAPAYSKVTTVLSPELKAGGSDNRTADEGVISGRADLAVDGSCYFYNLQRDCAVSVGDNIVTAGGSVFPAGLFVGTVTDIRQQSKDTSLYAVVDSPVEFDKLRKVMVVTYYSGQGFVAPSEEVK